MGTTINGRDYRIFMAESSTGTYKAAGRSTSDSISVQESTTSVKTKDDAGFWATEERTGMSWNGSFEALTTSSTDTMGYTTEELISYCLDGTELYVKFAPVDDEGEAGPHSVATSTTFPVLSGKCRISSFSNTTNTEGKATTSFNIVGIGELSI